MSNKSVYTPTSFNFHSHPVRVIMRENQPWFVAKDVCNALGYSNSRDAVATHLDDDEKGVATSDTLRGEQQLSIISESGLYALVLRSRKPEARKFAKWVTSEVLPSIRQNGYYTNQQARPLSDSEARQKSHQVALEYFSACHMEMARVGANLPAFPQVGPEIYEGLIAEMLRNSRFLVTFQGDGKINFNLLDRDVCVVSPRDSEDMRHLVQNLVPKAVLMQMMRNAFERLECRQ